MALDNTNPTATSAWRALQEHYAEMQHAKMQEMFAADKDRAEKFNIQWNDFTVDYSKNIINQKNTGAAAGPCKGSEPDGCSR